MFVNCFTVTRLYTNPINIETVYSELGQVSKGDQQLTLESAKHSTELGKNIPKYLQYEGGSGGNTYLCCVDISVDVKAICDKFAYECGTIYQIEIDDNKYNNSYTIYPTYSKDGAKFVLDIVKISSPDDH